jgi:putative copper export protein
MALAAALPDPSLQAAPAPSTPLGPIIDGVVTWTTWVTLMGCVGLLVFALVCARPIAGRVGPALVASTTTRLARIALVLGLLSLPAVMTDIAHGLSETGGYRYGAAFDALYDGTNGGRLLGLEVTLMAVAIVLVAPVALVAPSGRARGLRPGVRTALLGGGLVASAVALGTTKFPDEVPQNWSRDSFETVMWMLHLGGGAVWLGGLVALAALALPGVVGAADRASFWSPVIRRFSALAMSCVAAIALSGLWLYWEHVDGPTQLFTTMYGRVLGVKILIFGALLLLGAANQFWLHPRIEAMRAAGDERPLRTILVREFRVTVVTEVLLVMSVLMVAPFLHGSARNQAFQAGVEHRSSTPIAVDDLPRIADKSVHASTWIWGTAETVLVIGLMVGGLIVSGRLARRRVAQSTRTASAAGTLAPAQA